MVVVFVSCVCVCVCVCVFRRKNVLRIPRGWIYYLAPEIVQKMSPEVDEDQLPFSKAADVYAFGYWFMLIKQSAYINQYSIFC